jgi:N-methylhydantoinase B
MVDAVTLEVVRNACEAVAAEMNATLVQTGYSPNIKERRDCSCALFDADAALVAQAENMPVHLGAMPFSVAAAVDAFPDLAPGDAVLLNDPFRGGAHLPDLTLVSPVYADPDAADPELVAYAANRAHHADVGGATAGSVAADSTDIYQEGTRIPPVKLYDGGDPNDAVFDLLLANTRTPDERRGDLRAQQAANETARERVHDLVADHGPAGLAAAFDEIQDYSERRMRSAVGDLADGTFEFADVLDDDGRGNHDPPIEAAVTVDGDEVTVDFAGSADQTEGPVNAVFAVTASATYYALRCVTDPAIPPNAGCYLPITVDAPGGSIVNPDPPAAVVGGNLETSQRVTDVVLGALAQAAPDRVPAAGQGTMNNVTFGGTDHRDGSQFTFYETAGGGAGGRPAGDGLDAVHVHMSNTMNTPVEVLETAYPLRVRRYALREDSAGAGEFRGGLGLRRDIEVRGGERDADAGRDTAFSLLADRHTHVPYGLAGGESGARGEAVRFARGDYPDEDAGESLPQKCVRDLPAGTVVSLRTPGGGGHGDPADRDPEAVQRDLALGKLTRGYVRDHYPNALDAGGDGD